MILRSAHGWQLILADLSLILFLVTLSSLVSASSDGAAKAANDPESGPYIAPAQALYRKIDGGPDLDEWLNEQASDTRAALTIIALHTKGDRDAIWGEAQNWAELAHNKDVPVRVVINEAETSEIYASLAYDAPELEP